MERPSAAVTLKKPEAIAAILAIESGRRSDKQKTDLAAHYRTIAPALAAMRAERAKAQAELDGINNRVRKTMITTTAKSRSVEKA